MQRDIHTVERKSVAKDRNIASGLILICIIYIVSTIISDQLLTEDVIGIIIPNFA